MIPSPPLFVRGWIALGVAYLGSAFLRIGVWLNRESARIVPEYVEDRDDE